MADLFLLNRDRVIDYLKRRGTATVTDVAGHFGWSVRATAKRIENLAKYRLIQAEPSMAGSREHQRWSAVD